MITYNYFGKEEKIYYEKMNNGLEVYILPNKCRKSYHIEIVTKYGSNIQEFIPIGEKNYVKVPLGTAHFLEHKMFDMEKSDPFDFYAKTGSYINAGTNYFSTRYYVDGKKNFKKNFDYLLTMVFSSYFNEDTIEKEKGIITEEIKMYDDEPEWIMDFEAKKMIYQYSLQDKIAGTPDSILGINKEILDKVYKAFYQPSNMFIVISGYVNPTEIINIIKANDSLNKKISNYPIIYKQKKEKEIVNLEYKCLNENVVIPKLRYSFKFDLDKLPLKDLNKARDYLNAIFLSLFGSSSSFNEQVEENKLATYFYYDNTTFNNVYTLSIEAESEYADLFKDEVDKAVENIVISKDDFERIKKIWISIIIRSLDNNEALASALTNSLLLDDYHFDQYKAINDLSYEELLKVVKKLDFSNRSFILMLPKE